MSASPIIHSPTFDHITDDKGNKWMLVQIFSHDIQEFIWVLQPYSVAPPTKDGKE